MQDLSSHLSGAFYGVCFLVVVLSLLVGYAYNENMLWWHASAVAVAISAHLLSSIDYRPLAGMLWALQVGLATQALVIAVGTSGAMRRPAQTLRFISIIVATLAAFQVLRELSFAWLLLPWIAATGWYFVRSWTQSGSWVYWLALGHMGLLGQWLWGTAGVHRLDGHLFSLGALAVFAFACYLGMVWKSRQSAENALRVEARERIDPLTGLAMPRVFSDRVAGALVRSRNLKYLSALMLIRVANVEKIVAEQTMENNEAIILGASRAIASALRAQDSAARLASNKFGLLAEGVAHGEASELATKIIARGLRGEDWGLRGSSIEFHLAIIEFGPSMLQVETILHDLKTALDDMRLQNTGRPIRVVHSGPGHVN